MRRALGTILLLGALFGCTRAERKARHLVVATDASYQPFEFYNEKRELVGFDIDLMRAIGERAGFTVEFKNQPFDGILAGLESGKYDVVISALTITPERAQRVLFSDPYYDAGQAIAIRADDLSIQGLADLIGKRIGVQRGTTGALRAKEIPNAQVAEFDTIDLAFLALRNGAVAAVINDEPTSRSIVASRPGFRLVGVPLTNEKYGIALRKDATELARQINAALAELKVDGTLERLKEKWIRR